jgi:hypothetical protein
MQNNNYVLQFLISNFFSSSRQVGLVIGKLSSKLDRGFIFDLVPTPPNDAGESACSLLETTKDDNKRKGFKSKSQPAVDSSALNIDSDWVAEHARQVHSTSINFIYLMWFVIVGSIW